MGKDRERNITFIDVDIIHVQDKPTSHKTWRQWYINTTIYLTYFLTGNIAHKIVTEKYIFTQHYRNDRSKENVNKTGKKTWNVKNRSKMATINVSACTCVYSSQNNFIIIGVAIFLKINLNVLKCKTEDVKWKAIDKNLSQSSYMYMVIYVGQKIHSQSVQRCWISKKQWCGSIKDTDHMLFFYINFSRNSIYEVLSPLL